MPTFHFFKGGKKLDEVVGANVGKIEQLLHQYSSGGAGGAAFTGTGRVLGSGAAAESSNTSDKDQWNTMNFLVGAVIIYIVYQWYMNSN